jgi:hypothetical protein
MKNSYIKQLKLIQELLENNDIHNAKTHLSNLLKCASDEIKQRHDRACVRTTQIRKISGCPVYGRDDERKKKTINKELLKIKELQITNKKEATKQFEKLKKWGDVLDIKWLDYIINKALELEIDLDIIRKE